MLISNANDTNYYSSVSSSLSGSAACAWEDMVRPFLRHLTDYQATIVNRILGGQYNMPETSIHEKHLYSEYHNPVLYVHIFIYSYLWFHMSHS